MNFTIVKRGYNPEEVENYIKKLEQQLNEYKEKSSAINNAIINAQYAADNIIKDAHERTKKMLSSAELDAKNIKEKAINQVASMKSNIAAQRKVIGDFEKEYAAFLKKYLEPVSSSDVSPMMDKLNSAEKLINEFSSIMSAENRSEPEVQNKNADFVPAAEPTVKNENKPKPQPKPPVNKEPVKPANPYAQEGAAASEPMQKPKPVSQNFRTAQMPDMRGLNRGEAKPFQDKKPQETANPFAKKSSESVNPFAKNQVNTEDEVPRIDETIDYSALMSSSAGSLPNGKPKPGIYKASDFDKYDELNINDSDFVPSASRENGSSRMLTEDELDDLMPSHKKKFLK